MVLAYFDTKALVCCSILAALLLLVLVTEVAEWWNHRCPTCGSRDIESHYMYGQWCNACLKKGREK